MLASWEEGSVGFSPFKFCGNIVFDSSCVQLQLKAGGHLLGMMKIFSPCSIMIIVALLVATVSATKLNVPRLRLSHKGNLSIYLWAKALHHYFMRLVFSCCLFFSGEKSWLWNIYLILGDAPITASCILRIFSSNHLSSPWWSELEELNCFFFLGYCFRELMRFRRRTCMHLLVRRLKQLAVQAGCAARGENLAEARLSAVRHTAAIVSL